MTDTISRLLVTFTAILLMSLFLFGCSHEGHAADLAAVPTVPTGRAARMSMRNSVTLTAEFQPFFEVDVMAKEAGYIRHMNVDIGDHVRDGQILATLEIPELEADLRRAEAGVQKATAQIAVASGNLHSAQASNAISHLTYTRILDVSKKEVGLVPLQDVDVARSRDLESEAQVFAAQQQLAAAENELEVDKAELARQQALMGYTKIVAPFNGVVTRRYASDGTMIQAGTASQIQAMPVVRVSENDVLRLMLPVPEEYVGTVHDGQQVSVDVPSLNKSFAGKVTRFSNDVLMSTRTMTTEVDVKNPRLELVPGMYARVGLGVSDAPNAIVVPLSAIDGIGGNQRVFVVENNGVIRVQKVTTGIQTAEYIQILSGISDGSTVITGEHSNYYDGEKVQTHFEPVTSSSPSHE